jgi:hypothetical protein
MKEKKGIFGSIICALTFNTFGIILLIAAIQSNEPVAFSGWFFIFLFFFFGIAALVDIISTLKK